MRVEPSREPPLPPMAWAHVRGVARKVGGSNANEAEAGEIARWIGRNAASWTEHYGEPLAKWWQ